MGEIRPHDNIKEKPPVWEQTNALRQGVWMKILRRVPAQKKLRCAPCYGRLALASRMRRRFIYAGGHCTQYRSKRRQSPFVTFGGIYENTKVFIIGWFDFIIFYCNLIKRLCFFFKNCYGTAMGNRCGANNN